MENSYDIIVVGGGPAGLYFAWKIAEKNSALSVLVIEKHNRPGGYAHSFKRKGCVFDSAVRIVAGAEGRGLLSDLLKDMKITDLDVIKLDNIYRAVYPNHDITVGSGIHGFINSYCEAFPKESENIIKLVKEMKDMYDCTIKILESNNLSFIAL